MKKIKTPLPERLKTIRGSESQTSFAHRLGIPQQTYSHYESGKTEPPLGMLVAIAKMTGATTDFLLGIDGARGSVSVTATDHSVASNNSAVSQAQDARLLSLLESQQRIIERLTGATEHTKAPSEPPPDTVVQDKCVGMDWKPEGW